MRRWRQRRADEHHDYHYDNNNYPFVERGASAPALTRT
jgi:hypothetical protein